MFNPSKVYKQEGYILLEEGKMNWNVSTKRDILSCPQNRLTNLQVVKTVPQRILNKIFQKSAQHLSSIWQQGIGRGPAKFFIISNSSFK